MHGAELLEWMTREFEENRQSSDKQYWETHTPDGSLKAHDPRGTASFVNSELYNWVHHDSETAHQEALGAYASKQPSFFPHTTSFVACCQGRLRI